MSSPDTNLVARFWITLQRSKEPIERVVELGVQVEIYSFPRNTAKELRETATRFIPIDRRLLIKQPKESVAQEPMEA